jgi:hypothetical protein
VPGERDGLRSETDGDVMGISCRPVVIIIMIITSILRSSVSASASSSHITSLSHHTISSGDVGHLHGRGLWHMVQQPYQPWAVESHYALRCMLILMHVDERVS